MTTTPRHQPTPTPAYALKGGDHIRKGGRLAEVFDTRRINGRQLEIRYIGADGEVYGFIADGADDIDRY